MEVNTESVARTMQSPVLNFQDSHERFITFWRLRTYGLGEISANQLLENIELCIILVNTKDVDGCKNYFSMVIGFFSCSVYSSYHGHATRRTTRGDGGHTRRKYPPPPPHPFLPLPSPITP